MKEELKQRPTVRQSDNRTTGQQQSTGPLLDFFLEHHWAWAIAAWLLDLRGLEIAGSIACLFFLNSDPITDACVGTHQSFALGALSSCLCTRSHSKWSHFDRLVPLCPTNGKRNVQVKHNGHSVTNAFYSARSTGFEPARPKTLDILKFRSENVMKHLSYLKNRTNTHRHIKQTHPSSFSLQDQSLLHRKHIDISEVTTRASYCAPSCTGWFHNTRRSHTNRRRFLEHSFSRILKIKIIERFVRERERE